MLEVLAAIQSFVCKKGYINPDWINDFKFRLAENNKKPINVAIEFVEGQTCFYYSISLSVESIKESLYLSGCGKTKDVLLFERSSFGNRHLLKIYDKRGKSLNNSAIDGVLNSFFSKNSYSSTFAMFEELGVIKDLTIKKAYKWFSQDLVTLRTNPQLKSLISYMENDEAYARFTNEVIRSMDIGINNIQVKKEPIEEFLKHVEGANEEEKEAIMKLLSGMNDSSLFGNREIEIVKEKGNFVVKTLEFTQPGLDGYKGKLDFKDQSNGTKQLMHLMPLLYQIVHTKCVYCVDEIENGIHPINIKAFIKFFAENTKAKGQLIFTTHECHLLNQQELMRPDEVWFAEKHNGSTKLYSLNDFKEHNTIDVEKGYLAGRYGAIPYLGVKSDLTAK